MASLRLASWNINSVRLRLPLIARLCEEARPDILCLQETKVRNEAFPRQALHDLGFLHQHVHGMAGYNGLAILSKLPLAPVPVPDWCARGDCRHVRAEVQLEGKAILLDVLYVPSGGDIPDPDCNPKFAHKLAFLEEVIAWFGEHRDTGRLHILAGDLNIAPLPSDVWSHRAMVGVVSHTPLETETLLRWRRDAGLIDAIRHFVPPEVKLYSWWSYRARDFARSDRGRRLDHIWVTPAVMPLLRAGEVLRAARGWERPSDHVPVWIDLMV